MGKNPKTNRREVVEKLLKAAGGKMVSMYATIADGPGRNGDLRYRSRGSPRYCRRRGILGCRSQYSLLTTDETMAIRAKRVELQAAYAAPGQ
jgi:hypothetical protein